MAQPLILVTPPMPGIHHPLSLKERKSAAPACSDEQERIRQTLANDLYLFLNDRVDRYMEMHCQNRRGGQPVWFQEYCSWVLYYMHLRGFPQLLEVPDWYNMVFVVTELDEGFAKRATELFTGEEISTGSGKIFLKMVEDLKEIQEN